MNYETKQILSCTDLKPNEGFRINFLVSDWFNLKANLERLNISK